MGVAGNVLVGGLIGVGVDAITGAAKDLKPNPVIVKLVPLNKSDDVPEVPTESAPIAAARMPAEEPKQL